MKKLLCILLVLLLLTGCGNRVDLMPKASPETSALGLFVYDGETITRRHLFETDAVRAEVMEAFHNAKARPAEIDTATLTPPFYGLEMGGTDGWSVYGLWSDGYFVMGDGSVYEFDYDFEGLLERYDFEEPDEFQFLSAMPCASYVAKSENGWNKAFLTVTTRGCDPHPMPIDIHLVEQTDTHITVEFTNTTGEDWCYGHAFYLETELDGIWYRIPAEQDVVFTEEGLIVQAGGTAQERCWIEPYGTLPVGNYRLVIEDLAVGFVIE